MTSALLTLLSEQPILTLFVVIGLGYLLGRISIFGFRLGVAGVLFSGLFIGSSSSRITLPEFLPSLGLIIFVYTIGIQAGPQFFASFRRGGYRYTVLAIAVILIGLVVTATLAVAAGISSGRAAGLFAGALTNTPALAAARDKLNQIGSKDDPVAAYSIAYPFGVIGVLLALQFVNRQWRNRASPSQDSLMRVQTFQITNPGIHGRKVSDILREQGELGFVLSRIARAEDVNLVTSDTQLRLGDTVAVVGYEDRLRAARDLLGGTTDERLEEDRTQLDHLDIFVSSGGVAGRAVRDLDLQRRFGATITRIRRGDLSFVPDANTRLEHGDYIRMVTSHARFTDLRSLFGDSMRGTAEMDFGSVALGMVLGVLLGLVPISLPGGSVINLGLAGGPLIAAMLLGKLERTGGITWTIPMSANLSLRHFGTVLFLAGVGTRAGAGFLATVRAEGPMLICLGALITVLVHGTTLILGRTLLKAPTEVLMGLSAGVQTQPACLAYASEQCRSEGPDLGYASVYPAAMIAKIVAAQALVLFLP